jgi:hypothetical protein
MQFLITVNDPENGLGSGTERNLTQQIANMCDMWDRMPGIVARLEVHEEDVYGTQEGILHCDFCPKVEYADDLTPDWNGETGNHLSCEVGSHVVVYDGPFSGAAWRLPGH